MIAIDEEYSEEYKKTLYIAQATDNSDELVEIFKKCQNRLDDKLNNYGKLLEQIENEMN